MTRPRAYRWIVAWLSIAACTPLSLPEGGRQPIACVARADAHTKGTGETVTGTLQTAGIGLFAWDTSIYLDNRHFTYDGGSGTWLGNAYWPFGCALSFYAYAPYHADATHGSLVFPSGMSGEFPVASYTVASAPSQQEDLVLATPVLNRTQASGNVPLVFTHALAQVVFKARWTGEDPFVRRVVSRGLDVRIRSIGLENVRGSSSVTFYNGGYNWDSPAPEDLATYATESYSLTPANGSLAAADVATSALPQAPAYTDSFLLPAGVLYLIPQTLASTSRLRVKYGIYAADSLEEEFEAAFEIGLLDQHVWPAGGVFTYSLTLSLGGAPSVEASTAGEYIDQFLPGLEAGDYQNRVVDGSEAGKYGCGDDTNSGISNPGAYAEGASLNEET